MRPSAYFALTCPTVSKTTSGKLELMPFSCSVKEEFIELMDLLSC